MGDTVIVEKGAGDNDAFVAAQAIASAEGILRELLRTAASNPIMAFGTLMILSEIFYKMGIYDKNKRDKIDLFVGTVVGVEFTADVLGQVVGAFAKGGILSETKAAGFLQPSATTLVYGGDQMGMTSAILGKLLSK